jgi:hypothetical protein
MVTTIQVNNLPSTVLTIGVPRFIAGDIRWTLPEKKTSPSGLRKYVAESLILNAIGQGKLEITAQEHGPGEIYPRGSITFRVDVYTTITTDVDGVITDTSPAHGFAGARFDATHVGSDPNARLGVAKLIASAGSLLFSEDTVTPQLLADYAINKMMDFGVGILYSASN